MSPDSPYRTTVAVLEEIPLYLSPKVIQLQLKEAGGGVYEISVKRTHYYHFTVTVVRLVKWHRADVLRNHAIVVVPDVEKSSETVPKPMIAVQEGAHV
jgi:hypothetical protein